MSKLFISAAYTILFWLGVIGGIFCYPLSLIASYFMLSRLYPLLDGAKHEVTGLPIWYVSYLALAIGLACLYHASNIIAYSRSTVSGRQVTLDRAFDPKIRVATISAITGLLSMGLVLVGMVKSGELLPFNIWVPVAVGACALYLYAAFSPRVLGHSVCRGETRMRSSRNGDTEASASNEAAEQIAEVRKPRLNFSKLHGMRALKQRLLEAANPIVARKKKGDTQEARNGILLFGPPGNGKTGVAEALAGELGLPLLMLDYSKVVSQWVGETPRRLAAGFKQAKSMGPCVLFIDEIDSFAVSRDAGASRSQEADNIVNLLLTELVNIRQYPVIVVAATNRLEKLDAAAIREGRFDFKIEVTAPDEEARIGLLQDAVAKHGSGLLIDPDAVREAAKRWDEFSAKRLIAVGEELPGYAKESGVKEIGFAQLQAILRRVQGRKGRVPESTKGISDLVLREETAIAVQSVANRIRDPLRLERLGGTLPGGVLFHGPAGTGKTAVARALAKETGWALLSVAGPDLLKNSDELERIFIEAKDIRPTLLFIDEADDILRDRQYSTSSAITNKLLTLMDGSQGRVKDVVILAATNNPDQIDPALLRGGRFTEKVPFHVADEANTAVIVARWLSAKRARLVDLDESEVAVFLQDQSPANIEAVLQHALNLAIEETDTDDVRISRSNIEASARLVLV